MIKDAESYYASIKQNALFKDKEDEAMVGVLDDQFALRFKAAQQVGASGEDRDQYFFFQGMIMGNYLMSRMFLHHYKASAAEQSVNLATGKKFEH